MKQNTIQLIIVLVIGFLALYCVQLFAQQSIRNGFYVGDSTNTGIYPSTDSDSIYVTVNGDTVIILESDELNITGSPATTSPPVSITNNTNYPVLGLITGLTPNMANSALSIFRMGKAETANNSFAFSYKHIGDGSTSNILETSFYDGSSIFSIQADGEVSVTGNLSVSGTISGQTKTIKFGCTVDSASALTDSIKVIWDNDLGATMTITELFILASEDDFPLTVWKKDSTNTKTTIEALTATTAGYDGFYTRDVSLSSATVANKEIIGFDRPDSTAKSVYLRGKGTYTVP